MPDWVKALLGVASSGQHDRGQAVSEGELERERLGRWIDGESRMARGPGARPQSRDREACAARSSSARALGCATPRVVN
jgi:hypothetical protein